MSSDQPYTPDGEDMENRYVLHSLSLMDFPRGDREEWAEKLHAEFQRGLARVRRDAAREVGDYIEHLHPNGPTHTTAVLADIDLAANRMGRGLYANGRKRDTP